MASCRGQLLGEGPAAVAQLELQLDDPPDLLLGEQQRLDAALAAQLPNLLFIAGGLLLLALKGRR